MTTLARDGLPQGWRSPFKKENGSGDKRVPARSCFEPPGFPMGIWDMNPLDWIMGEIGLAITFRRHPWN